MTQCINMHKRAKTSINVEVLVNDKTCVPHETRTQRNALPCTACGNIGSRKRQNGVSSGSVSGKSCRGLGGRRAKRTRKARGGGMSPRSGAMKSVRTASERVVGRRAGKKEVLRYIELYDKFCLPQDRPKRNRKRRNATENNEKL